MDSLSPALAAHKGLRGDILVELKKAQSLTANQLAETFGVSANAIRRHLKELEVEGLVDHDREHRGLGAPTHAFHLSKHGEALFPNRYEEALTRFLEHVMATEGRGAAVSVMKAQYDDLRGKLGADVASITPIDRLKAVARVLGDAGFMAESDEADGELRLRIHNCAIRAVASHLPETCEAEMRFLEQALAANIERRTHIIEGCNACEYAVNFGERAVPAVDEWPEERR